jgi:hypothetical protein
MGKWFNSRNGFGSDQTGANTKLSYLAAIKRGQEQDGQKTMQIELPAEPVQPLPPAPAKIFD